MYHAAYEMLAFCVANNLCALFLLKCPADDAVGRQPGISKDSRSSRNKEALHGLNTTHNF